jgi:hypothetical protein
LAPERSCFHLTTMSAPASQAKPPGDEFVLWPESLGQGPGTVNEAVIRRSLAGLAPSEWVADPASQEAGEVEQRELAGKEERFYPASRQWFRTTTSIPPSEATEKWWQAVPAAPPAPVSESSPPVLPERPAHPAAAVSSELLSPEEIWELAAEELEQASRLGAPAAASASIQAEKPTVGLQGPSAGVGTLGSPPPAIPAEPADPAAAAGPPVPVVLPAAPAAVAAVVPVAVTFEELPVAAALMGDLSEIPSRERSEPVASVEADLECGLITELPVVAAPAPVVAPAAESPAWVQLPAAGASVEETGGADAAPALAAPVIAFPKSASASPAGHAPPMPVADSASPETPEADAVDATAVEAREPKPASPLPVEPLAAIPVAARLPFSLRKDKSGTPLPTQRRKGSPGSATGPVFADLGMATGNVPASEDDAVAVEEPPTDEVQPSGERRRRRKRAERRQPQEPPPSRRSWMRWGAGILGLLLVMTVVAAVVARDQLPSEWRRSATRWWQKGHQLLFPHQYGYPRRGVVPRAGQPSDTPSAIQGAHSTDGAGDSKQPDGGGPPTVAEPAASAGGAASDRALGAPPPLPLVESAQPPVPAPGLPPTPERAAPEAAAIAAPAGEIFAPRAEPVPEDEEQLAPDEAPDDVAPSAPGQNPQPVEPNTTPVATGPAVPPSSAAAGEESAQVVASDSSEFTLWDGDAPPGGADGGQAVRRDAAPEATSSEVAEGKKAVQSLVAARSAAEVLPWIFDADTLETAVRSYYAQHPLQPLADAVIEHEYSGTIPATGGKAHIFNVLAASHPRGFPVSAEATPQGYRIDWQSYIQWRDGWLRRFLDSKSETPQTLFVVLRRTHYFNDDVPKLDEKLAFKLTSAVPGDEGAVAFVDKNSAVGRSLAEMYEWRTMYFPVVELQWVPAGRDARYLRLNRIVRPTWRRIGE